MNDTKLQQPKTFSFARSTRARAYELDLRLEHICEEDSFRTKTKQKNKMKICVFVY